MPYYIYQINQTPGSIVKNLKLLKNYEAFQQAKAEVRAMRKTVSNVSKEDPIELKIIFAESELQAEELLQEKRETPVLMEWEK